MKTFAFVPKSTFETSGLKFARVFQVNEENRGRFCLSFAYPSEAWNRELRFIETDIMDSVERMRNDGRWQEVLDEHNILFLQSNFENKSFRKAMQN